jgi:protein TonB
MFEASLLDSAPLLPPRNRWPAVFSFGLQALIVAALLVIPLVHPEVLPLALPKLQLVAPRFNPPKPPPPILQQVPTLLEIIKTAAPAPPTRPAVLPSQAFRTDAQTVDTPALAVGMNLGAQGPNPLSALLGSAPKGSPVAIGTPPSATVPATPIRITGGVLSGMLLAPIHPEYPPIARISHTEGTIVVEAIISKSGHIESAHVVSGPAMLQPSALQAVRDARYRPFLLNGQPTEVSTTVSINFRLGGG